MKVESLAAKMRDAPFTLSSDSGFLLDRVRNSFVEGRYIERINYEDHVLDPFGNETVNRNVEYRVVKFRLSDKYPELQISDPPRTARGFINSVLQLTDFNSEVESVRVDPQKWLENLQSQKNLVGRVTSAKIIYERLSAGAIGKLNIIASKQAVEVADKLGFNGPRSISKIKFEPNLEKGHLVLSESGVASFSIKGMIGLVDDMRLSLPRDPLK
ncbi:hypothetical protein [Aureimonas sp. Leaf454]|uniref:hypothetical protein n=1 Tax=Aureimonas sp. Leaf454 TaxID=1736381 RepID=UPI0012E33BD7|nr:hypothetical protein [Aureimonas sp. Leaf454]